jgi:hypothetical protein
MDTRIFTISYKDIIRKKLNDFKARINKIEHSLSKCICPIYSINEKNAPELLGSSVLLKVSKLHFLVTAAHVIKENKNSTLYLFGRTKLIELIGTVYTTPFNVSINSKESKNEFAFMLLDDLTIQELIHFEYLNNTDIEPNDYPHEKKLYTFVGYPASKNKPRYDIKSIKRSVFSFTNNSCGISDYIKLGVEQYSHINISFDKYKGIDNQGRIKIMPDPWGMSGGGIWSSIDLSSFPLKYNPKLVGIGIEYHKKEKIMLGIKISLVIESLKKYYPEVGKYFPESNLVKVNINK